MRESVIEFAEKRMAEEDRAGEEQNTLYWAAYLDGARAQAKEDAKNPHGPMREILVDHRIDLRNMSEKLYAAEMAMKRTGVYASDGQEIMKGDRVRGLFLYGLPIIGEVVFRSGSFGVEWDRGGVKEFTPFTSTCNVSWEIVKEARE